MLFIIAARPCLWDSSGSRKTEREFLQTSGIYVWGGCLWPGRDPVCASVRAIVITGRDAGKSESATDRVTLRQGDGTEPGRVWGALKSWHLNGPGSSCLLGGTECGIAELPVIFPNFFIAVRDPLNTAPTCLQLYLPLGPCA